MQALRKDLKSHWQLSNKGHCSLYAGFPMPVPFTEILLLLLHLFISLFSRTTRVSWYQKGKTSLDLDEARDDGVLRWQRHQLDHMQTICTSLQTDNHTNHTQFSQAGYSSWHPTNSVKALKAFTESYTLNNSIHFYYPALLENWK